MKVSGLNAFLATERTTEGGEPEEFFAVVIAKPVWDILDEKQRLALVDHELCHFDLDEEKGTPVLRSHDVEEFGEIVKRHGLWRDEVRRLVEVGAKQLSLGLNPPPPDTKPRARRANGATR